MDGAPTGRDENHREPQRVHLMLQLFYERAAAGIASGRERREAFSGLISQAEGCRVREIVAAARSVKEVKALVVGAWMVGRASACAESANRKAKDAKHRSRGSTKRENMRRRLLSALGYPPLEKGGAPLPNRSEQAAAGGSPERMEALPSI